MRIRQKHIRAMAQKLLEDSGVSRAPVPVEKLARSLKAEVRTEDGPDDISGFLLRERGKGSAIIGVNASHHLNRRRFTIAHEIGHLLLHDHEDLHVDRNASFLVMRRDGHSSTGESHIEREANLFAAELLMPFDFLLQDLEGADTLNFGNDGAIADLAAKYKVSAQAMSIRLGSLGLTL